MSKSRKMSLCLGILVALGLGAFVGLSLYQASQGLEDKPTFSAEELAGRPSLGEILPLYSQAVRSALDVTSTTLESPSWERLGDARDPDRVFEQDSEGGEYQSVAGKPVLAWSPSIWEGTPRSEVEVDSADILEGELARALAPYGFEVVTKKPLNDQGHLAITAEDEWGTVIALYGEDDFTRLWIETKPFIFKEESEGCSASPCADPFSVQ